MPRYVQARPTTEMTKLMTAIRCNDLQGFQHVLDTQGLPSSKNNADFMLLKKALLYGRADIAKLLLDRGCRVYNQFHNGNSPLHLAASKRNCGKLVRRLLDHGARVDQKNSNGETPLHFALNFAEGKVIDLMLENHLRNSFVNESNRFGMSFLHVAATRSSLYNVRCLVEVGHAFVNSQIDVKANSPYAGFSPLHMAVEFNQPRVAELLLSYGADLWSKDANGSTPLHLALERKNLGMVELFLANDYKRENYVNDFGLSHFMAACTSSDPTISMAYLLNPVNSKTALVNERVDKFRDMSYPFKNYTPLHFAAENGRQDIVKVLLENGARLQSRNNSRHLARTNGYHHAADRFVMQCLRHDWSPDVTSMQIRDDRYVEPMECDDDSGYFDGDNSNFDESSSYDSDDFSEISYSTEDELDFWEDDIEEYLV